MVGEKKNALTSSYVKINLRTFPNTLTRKRIRFGPGKFQVSVRAYTKGIVSSLICGGLLFDRKTSHRFLREINYNKTSSGGCCKLSGKYGQENSPEGNRSNHGTNFRKKK